MPLLKPLNETILNTKDTFWDQDIVKMYTVNGKPYLVNVRNGAWDMGGACVVYNKRIFEDNGIGTPSLYYLSLIHIYSLKDDNVEFVRALGSRIIALHVSDYDFINERHRMPYDGKNDWKGIMNTLKEAGYSGTWNYEVSTDGRSAAEFTENYARLLENA